MYFFHCYGRPQDLHSFPTRRSSDLAFLKGRVNDLVLGEEAAQPRKPRQRQAADKHELVRPRPPGAGGVSGAERSEEHTSELQSLTNLVCRLLLEKKKNLQHTRSHRD